jgi:PPOX class probable F420-dependent enzyme
MSAQIPNSHKDLLTNPVHATIATIMPDGQPQLSVVWCNYDGEHILVNTARGRQKDKNLGARPQATILLIDPQNPYRYLEVRGTVEMTEEGAVEHISQLAKLYTGADSYYGGVTPADQAEKETRVICKITPTRVTTAG